ncbi:unnamed protein product [Ilex paraguariensis]|uniref:Uncharacterized protein n=1 Tax=Ilex paraguariensis TaxID=185542 RepID=A0ABC8RAA5_9AQUA
MLASLLSLLFLSFLPLLFLLKPKSRAVLNVPPSSQKLPIIGNLHQFGSIPHFLLWKRKLSQKYSSIMLLQAGRVPTLIFSSSQTAKEVLKTHDIDCCGKPHTHGQKRISYNLLDVAFSPYGEYWREMHKICVLELFTAKRVESFSFIRESESYAGRQIENGKFLDAIDEAKAMVHSFWFGDFIPYVGWIGDVFMGLHRRLEKCIGSFDAFVERVIADHLDPSRLRAEHEDIIDVMLRLLRDQNSSIRLTNDHIKPCLLSVTFSKVWSCNARELAHGPQTLTAHGPTVHGHLDA